MAEFLIVVVLPGTGERFTHRASGRVTVGRSQDSDVWLPYPTVSRPHAEIELLDTGEFQVRDLGSRNGTVVNGEAVRDASVTVPARASLQVGPYVLTLLTEDQAEETITVTALEATPRLRLDRGRHALLLGDQTVLEPLSNLEFKLLDRLEANAPNVVSNADLGDHLWGAGQWDIYMLHNLIRRVRRKLGEKKVEAEAHLVTVAGVGYRLA